VTIKKISCQNFEKGEPILAQPQSTSSIASSYTELHSYLYNGQ
jgi:hypothetical protein